MDTNQLLAQRRVMLLETDERAGLVAGIAASFASQGLSLDITTGPGHVLLTFLAQDDQMETIGEVVSSVPGVKAIHPYSVVS